MRHLLDTNILVAIVNDEAKSLPAPLAAQLAEAEMLRASVVSLWELAIKTRLGKLELRTDLLGIPAQLENAGLAVLKLSAEHALTEALPVPGTRDPFDRLLLAICRVEQLSLLTTDRALAGHPLAWPYHPA